MSPPLSGDVRGVNRDVFACSPFGNFDTHRSMKSSLSTQFEQIDNTLASFKNELKAMNMWDSVTVVLTSEFGRTLTPNSSGGTDHGWGANVFMMGGNVKGGIILGEHPDNYRLDDQYITGRGAWIPRYPWESICKYE